MVFGSISFFRGRTNTWGYEPINLAAKCGDSACHTYNKKHDTDLDADPAMNFKKLFPVYFHHKWLLLSDLVMFCLAEINEWFLYLN